MNKTLSLLSLTALTLCFSSCCSMFGIGSCSAGTRIETRQVKTGKFDVVTEEIYTGSGKSGMTKTIEKKVPRYKTVTKKVRVSSPKCVRLYCPKKDSCGTTSESYRKLVTSQGPVGSPHIGLVPTMRKLAE